LEEVLQRHLKTLEVASQSSAETNAQSAIMGKQTKRGWKDAESHCSLGYSGRSACTTRHHKQLARRKGEEDAKLRDRWVGPTELNPMGTHISV
jgi:hypothetical protein